jgi:hypothetical protein
MFSVHQLHLHLNPVNLGSNGEHGTSILWRQTRIVCVCVCVCERVCMDICQVICLDVELILFTLYAVSIVTVEVCSDCK